LTFAVPKVNSKDHTSKILSMTIGLWDHEYDLDTYTWSVWSG
jgi:hypothetical protein